MGVVGKGWLEVVMGLNFPRVENCRPTTALVASDKLIAEIELAGR